MSNRLEHGNVIKRYISTHYYYYLLKYILNNNSIERRIINDVKIALSRTVFEMQNTEEIKTKYRPRPICMLSLVLVAKSV